MKQLEDKIKMKDKNQPAVYVAGEFHNASFKKETTKFEYKIVGTVN